MFLHAAGYVHHSILPASAKYCYSQYCYRQAVCPSLDQSVSLSVMHVSVLCENGCIYDNTSFRPFFWYPFILVFPNVEAVARLRKPQGTGKMTSLVLGKILSTPTGGSRLGYSFHLVCLSVCLFVITIRRKPLIGMTRHNITYQLSLELY